MFAKKGKLFKVYKKLNLSVVVYANALFSLQIPDINIKPTLRFNINIDTFLWVWHTEYLFCIAFHGSPAHSHSYKSQ